VQQGFKLFGYQGGTNPNEFTTRNGAELYDMQRSYSTSYRGAISSKQAARDGEGLQTVRVRSKADRNVKKLEKEEDRPMERKNLMRHGFIGIGQGGGNILNSGFYKDFPVFVINTAKADLDGLKNIPGDCKYLAQVTDGGAGKEIAIGEYAIQAHKEKIASRIDTLFRDCEYVWIVTGFGGGTGTLGAIQMIQLLTEMGKVHGLIGTTPLEHEGTTEKANSLVGLAQLYEAGNNIDLFKGFLLIDNKKLKQTIMNRGEGFSYESLWETANAEIYEKFHGIYNFTEQSGQTCLDLEDYKRIFKEKGGIVFAEAEVDPAGNSESSLALAVMEMLGNTFFIGGDVLQGKAVGVIVERPHDFDTDGAMIDRLFTELKNKFQAGLFCRGVYKSNLSLKETISLKRKPVRLVVIVSGIPYPVEFIRDLNVKTAEEIAIVDQKNSKREDLGINMGDITKFLQKTNTPPERPEKTIDLTVFPKHDNAAVNWKFK
jgi:cell division GTPase FtsZ